MRTIICLGFLFVSLVLQAQSLTIRGRVRTEKGDPLFASVVLKGTSSGVATDNKGRFSIRVTRLPQTLVFSAVGYESLSFLVKAIPAGKDSLVEIKLTESKEALKEVVITGYATTRKTSVTGSTSEVVSKEGLMSMRMPGVALKERSDEVETTVTRDAYKKLPEGSIDARSKILTAGELSDFKKWKMWEDYTKGEFDVYRSSWGLAFQHRYCVQLQNQDHRIIAGEPVFLINAQTKDTVWRAVSDNTGKAELWASSQEIDEQAIYQIVTGGQVLDHPSTFEQGINQVQIKRSCASSNIVDIAFVVDATGSMGDEINFLKLELEDIISATSKKHADLQINLGTVFYRDRSDAYLTKHLDFRSDPAPLLSFIKEQDAQGGGDTPEAVEEGLQTAMDSLHWSDIARTRLLFLVLDAPPHEDAKNKMSLLIRQAAAKGIRIVPVVCSGTDKSLEYLMRCAALATNGTYVFLTDDSGVGEKHIKPTTDNYTVELLNGLLLRLISEMIYMPSCSDAMVSKEPVAPQPENILKITVYPNPSEGMVTIDSNKDINEIYLTDFTGKILMRAEGGQIKRKWKLNLGSYPSGTYLVKYLTKDNSWGSEKVVLIH